TSSPCWCWCRLPWFLHSGCPRRTGGLPQCPAVAAGFLRRDLPRVDAVRPQRPARRSKRLDATGAQEMELKVGVLEKFDPAAPDWRAPEAQMERPRRIAEEEERRSEQKALERQTGPLTGRYNHSSDVEDRDAARRDRMAEADARRRSDVWSQMDEPTERTQPEEGRGRGAGRCELGPEGPAEQQARPRRSSGAGATAARSRRRRGTPWPTRRRLEQGVLAELRGPIGRRGLRQLRREPGRLTAERSLLLRGP
ncbi:unnamed protein product, partial [Prorocentrum cordatum]